MVGTGILRYLIDNRPSARIRAAYHSTEPFIHHKNIEYVYCDLTSLDECRKIVRDCDCSIMAAGYTGGAGLTTSFLWAYIEQNLIMNTRMLEAFQLENVRRVIYVSSATLYQDFHRAIREDDLDLNIDPQNAHIGFGWVVRFTERLCKLLHEQHGIEILIARAANIFGPFTRFDPKTSNFIPAIIRKAVSGMDPFEVWGNPEVTRDVIYVDDFARAIVMMLEKEDIVCDVFNIGSGIRTTVGDVVKWALKHAKYTPKEIRYLQDKPTTAPFRLLDCSKIQGIVGWKPECSIEKGVEETVKWWYNNCSTWKR